ncbi:MAG TPA: sulfite exporter TauE/SafE family protein, partial [Anaerolineae bacterium]|nr:sulfite exporter TauE/SafE family protein [Anaerolineae bacterium]
MEPFLLFVVALLAAFTQSLTGFGSALVSMAVLPGLIGIRTAAPLVTLITVTIDVALLARYRQALNLRAIWRLVAALVLGVPLGILVLRRVEERFVLAILGAVIAGYALYALLSPRLPRLEHPAWAYGFGFIAGVLGGAYNTSGPPVVIFGNCQRWPPSEFKGNLQGFFLVNDLLVIAGHALSQNLTPLVLRD